MNESYIGWWATRVRRKGGKWHRVESEVTDRLVMRCGRQMRLVVGNWGLVFEKDPTWQRCKVCSR